MPEPGIAILFAKLLENLPIEARAAINQGSKYLALFTVFYFKIPLITVYHGPELPRYRKTLLQIITTVSS